MALVTVTIPVTVGDNVNGYGIAHWEARDAAAELVPWDQPQAGKDFNAIQRGVFQGPATPIEGTAAQIVFSPNSTIPSEGPDTYKANTLRFDGLVDRDVLSARVKVFITRMGNRPEYGGPQTLVAFALLTTKTKRWIDTAGQFPLNGSAARADDVPFIDDQPRGPVRPFTAPLDGVHTYDTITLPDLAADYNALRRQPGYVGGATPFIVGLSGAAEYGAAWSGFVPAYFGGAYGHESVIDITYDDGIVSVISIDSVTHAGAVHTISGSMRSGSTVAVSCPGASVGAVSYPTSTTWTVQVTGGGLITATESTTGTQETVDLRLAVPTVTFPGPGQVKLAGVRPSGSTITVRGR